MKIYNNKQPQLQDVGQNVQNITKSDANQASQKTQQSAPTDKVEISGKAKEIAELMAVINQMPDIRAEKVAEIKKAIESGNYTINPTKIAESILNEI